MVSTEGWSHISTAGVVGVVLVFLRTFSVAESDSATGTEAVTELDRLCREVALRFPRSVFSPAS